MGYLVLHIWELSLYVLYESRTAGTCKEALFHQL